MLTRLCQLSDRGVGEVLWAEDLSGLKYINDMATHSMLYTHVCTGWYVTLISDLNYFNSLEFIAYPIICSVFAYPLCVPRIRKHW
jgi:hypothetical protein